MNVEDHYTNQQLSFKLWDEITTYLNYILTPVKYVNNL